jgi:hypothetical protein
MQHIDSVACSRFRVSLALIPEARCCCFVLRDSYPETDASATIGSTYSARPYAPGLTSSEVHLWRTHIVLISRTRSVIGLRVALVPAIPYFRKVITFAWCEWSRASYFIVRSGQAFSISRSHPKIQAPFTVEARQEGATAVEQLQELGLIGMRDRPSPATGENAVLL